MSILITGGSGFLGRQLAKTLGKDHRVWIGARNQKNLMAAAEATGCPGIPVDVTNIESVRDVVISQRPDVIIHAAATKFVDLSEREPLECVDVNVLGSRNVARVAMAHGVKTVIGISTDKAAPPVRNTYGLSKALMEKMFIALNGRGGTKFLCVRYGNVAWSTGSVLPIWKKTTANAGLIQLTGPEMRRFFFTVEEAVGLVLVALANVEVLAGKVLTMPMKSAQMSDVAAAWNRIHGGRWEVIGPRPGEREDEYLIGESELAYASQTSFKGHPYYTLKFNEPAAHPLTEAVSTENAKRLTSGELIKLLKGLPEDARAVDKVLSRR